MSIPCVAIQRHDFGFYEWMLLVEQEQFDGDVGDSSIKECLVSASRCLPVGTLLVEIKYRGIHMGTFRVKELAEFTEEIAERIAGSYGEFRQSM